jgi:hypothetical protein
MNTISIAGGGVTGRAHLRAGRGSQDAMAWRAGDVAIAVVCDGCSGGARSEVGAAIGARLWVAALAERIDAGSDLDGDAPWDAARDAVVARLGELARAMGGELARTVRDHFLFTSVIAVWNGRQVAVRAIGDGVIAIDGHVRALGPFEDNAPPYLGHALVGDPPVWSARIVRASDSVDRVLIATDGAATAAIDDLAALARDERWFKNPDALRRHLAIVNREDLVWDAERGAVARVGAPLDDDATIVVLRKERAS